MPVFNEHHTIDEIIRWVLLKYRFTE